MQIQELLTTINADFFTGVPDSQLRPLCDYLIDTYGIGGEHHIIAANEGNSVGIAAGYHLATRKVPVVYLQNSGEGNIINPVASLINENVYAIPMIFIVGWRGEPNISDEPQHVYQGKITLKLLEDLDIKYLVIDKNTEKEDIVNIMKEFNTDLNNGKSVAFVVKKGALTYTNKSKYVNEYSMTRESVIEKIVEFSNEDPIICTTGKSSRELFEIRSRKKQSHKYDFLTVGSMGHTSSIALGVALNSKGKKVWCIDGDGSLLMHMGATAVIGKCKPNNLIHIIINNEAHESVGGMPTVSDNMDVVGMAKACGYKYTSSVKNMKELEEELNFAKKRNELTMIEIKCAIGARNDLGRPTTTPKDNKESFMNYIK